MKKKNSGLSQKQKKKIVKVVLIALASVMAVGCVYMAVMVFQQVNGFSKEKLLSQESSVVLDQEGNEVYSYSSDGARKNVTYDEIPQVMIDAVVSAEDSRFFEHNGFDLPRIVKAMMGNLAAGGITGGGSTITQQVIKKSYYPKEERTIERKIGEIILAIEATSQVSKEEILELYLNKIYFGYGNKAIGLYSASRYYFDKSVQNLTLPEAALLAGTLNSPNRYDPFKNLDLATQRRNTILDLMELHGYITSEECEITKKIPVENTLKSNPINSSGRYQAYIDMVTREVEEKTGLDPQETSMKIYTYMDTDVQSKLDDISNGVGYKFYDDDIQAGAIVQESTTGRVTAVLSARDYSPMGSTNAYAQKGVKTGGYGQPHQPGSSLKPIISYASAFEFLDYSTAHYVHDIPYSAGGWTPKNHDGRYHGDLSISAALSNSWNLAAINTFSEVLNEIGEDGATEYLEGFGIDMSGEDLSLASAIGGWSYGITPREEASAYATISNGGTYIESHAVNRIEVQTTGEVIELDQQLNEAKTEALSAESAFMIRNVMTDYVKSASNYSTFDIGLQIGAKTGTTNWSNESSIPSALRGKSKDSWLSAYSPDYAWSVWVGYPDDVAKSKKKWLRSGRDSRGIAAIIARTIHNGKVKNSYPSQPEGVSKASIISGIYPYVTAGSGVPSSRIVSGWFKKTNLPSGSASGASLNNLDSFQAAIANNRISVSFTPYDPESMTQSATPTKTYKVGGRSYTLPYYGDISQIYGRVVYVAQVTDSNGRVVHTQNLNSASGTLSFTPTGGQTYTVTGYYAFESGNGTSNKITATVSATTSLGASYSVVSHSEGTLVLHVVVPSGNSVTVSAGGTSQVVNSSSNVTFTGISSGTTVSFVESTSDGKQQTLTPYTMP